jgi:hypothetical protein
VRVTDISDRKKQEREVSEAKRTLEVSTMRERWVPHRLF